MYVVQMIVLTRAEDVDVTEQRDFRASCTLAPRASTSPQATPFLLPAILLLPNTTLCNSATIASTSRDPYRSRMAKSQE